MCMSKSRGEIMINISEFLYYYDKLPNSIEYKGLILRKTWNIEGSYTVVRYLTNQGDSILEFSLLTSQLIKEIKSLVSDYKSTFDTYNIKALPTGR